jgi:hypothetical protein
MPGSRAVVVATYKFRLSFHEHECSPEMHVNASAREVLRGRRACANANGQSTCPRLTTESRVATTTATSVTHHREPDSYKETAEDTHDSPLAIARSYFYVECMA